jgi:uncharacterized membrane protein
MQPVCLVLMTCLLGYEDAPRDPAVPRLQVIAPRDDGISATAINGRGEIVGFEWVEEKDHPGVLSQRPFYARGKDMVTLPLLSGYTATFPAALSDDGLVVGRASKAAPPNTRVPLRNQAFLWDAGSGIRGLGVLADDAASLACGISRDGRRISGFSVGPNRMRACLWEREGETWRCTALPQEFQLGSNVVVISDDGRRVAAVDGVVPCLWTRNDAGEWTREVIGEAGSLIPRGVNNAGTVVGLRSTNDGLTHAVLWSRDGGYIQLAEPEKYVRSEASAVNNAGVVVGMVDGPHGSPIGPNAFVYEKGRLRLIDEGGPSFAAATAINDRGQVAGVLEKDEETEKEEGKSKSQGQGQRKEQP